MSGREDGRDCMDMLFSLFRRGGTVESGGVTYAMGEDGDICWVDSEGIGRGMGFTLKAMKSLAEEIGKEELWLKLCAMSLRDMNERRGVDEN